MPPIPGMMHWHSLLARHAKNIKSVFTKGLQTLDEVVSGQPRVRLEPIPIRNNPKQPLHPLARIRQTQSRWYSTARRSLQSARAFTTTAGPAYSGPKYDRAAFPRSVVGSRIQSSAGRAPFASTLRPNLTGGTLGRTAGGYTLGGGRVGGPRYFSHGPASQAQVVQHVSQAMRAFFVSGQKAQFDGVSPFSGEHRFRAVSCLQEQTGRKMRSLPKATPGSWVDFKVNPSITALTPLAGVVGFGASEDSVKVPHINSEGLMDALSVDFSRALKDLAAIHNDIKRLSTLGDLLITYEDTRLRVHFPGCDYETVEGLCNELGVRRGVVIQDEAFDSFVGAEIALLFPLAPSKAVSWDQGHEGHEFYDTNHRVDEIKFDDMLTPDLSEQYSSASGHGFDDVLMDEAPWYSSSPSGFQSVRTGSAVSDEDHSPLEYQGFEGIYRFIEELDAVERRR